MAKVSTSFPAVSRALLLVTILVALFGCHETLAKLSPCRGCPKPKSHNWCGQGRKCKKNCQCTKVCKGPKKPGKNPPLWECGNTAAKGVGGSDKSPDSDDYTFTPTGVFWDEDAQEETYEENELEPAIPTGVKNAFCGEACWMTPGRCDASQFPKHDRVGYCSVRTSSARYSCHPKEEDRARCRALPTPPPPGRRSRPPIEKRCP